MLEKIFSIKNYSDTHKILLLAGIKIKFPKPEAKKLLKNLPYNKFKKINKDISSLPPAIGQFRDLQLANLALLLELDFVCKTQHVTYWLDFGTLLGAVRHQGFIPWDDDIDIGMLRNDYESFVEIFNKSCRDKDIFASYSKCTNKPCQVIIKIQHKKCPHIFVDIFPYDFYSEALSRHEQYKKTLEIKNLRKLIEKKYRKEDKTEDIKKIIDLHSNFTPQTSYNKPDLHWGIEYNHHWRNWFSNYDYIFPLKEIVFENILFPCINNSDEYLKKVYGNYMQYPKKFGYGHNMFAKLSIDEENIIKELRSRSEKSFNLRNV